MRAGLGFAFPAPQTLPESKLGSRRLERPIRLTVQVQRADEVRVEGVVGADKAAAPQGERADNRSARSLGLLGEHVHQGLSFRPSSALNIGLHQLGRPWESAGILKTGDPCQASSLFKANYCVVRSTFAELQQAKQAMGEEFQRDRTRPMRLLKNLRCVPAAHLGTASGGRYPRQLLAGVRDSVLQPGIDRQPFRLEATGLGFPPTSRAEVNQS